MISVYPMAGLVAAALGPTWTTDRGPWGVNARLGTLDENDGLDNYTLDVDNHGHLCLAALTHPGGDLASFPEPHGSNDTFRTANAIADTIREYEAQRAPDDEDA